MSNTKPQIDWLVERYYNDDDLINLAASNMSLQDDFVEEFGEVSEPVWKSRIKDAAERIGLTGRRVDYDYCAAWCRWEIVYS